MVLCRPPLKDSSPIFQVFPIVSLIMLSLCYLPGVIASFVQLYRGTKYRSDNKTSQKSSLLVHDPFLRSKLRFACSRRFPDWLDRWMRCRKQMGLIALAFAFLHAIYTFVTSTRYSVRHKLISLVVDEVQQQAWTNPAVFLRSCTQRSITLS